jgi:Uma2 family endonuclease
VALANVHRFTTDEFLAIDGLPRRVELLDGVIYDMSPEGPAHARAQRDVLNALTAALPDWDVLVGGSVHVTETSCPIPDVAVYGRAAGQGRDAFAGGDAALVVEIGLSTAWTDRARKLPGYAGGEVAEVWLIAPDASTLTCFRSPVDGQYTEERELAWPDGLAKVVERLVARLS